MIYRTILRLLTKTRQYEKNLRDPGSRTRGQIKKINK